MSRAIPIAEGPLGVIDLLDGSFAALRQRARVIVAIAAGAVIPLSLFQAWVSRDDLGGATFSDLLNDPTVAQEVSQSSNPYDLGFFIAQIMSMFVTAVVGVAVARVVGGWFEGRDTGAGEAMRFTMGRAFTIATAFVVIHLIELVGFILLVVPGATAVVAFSLTSPVLALEHVGAIESIRRSARLVRRRPGTVVGVIVLLAVVQYGVSQAVGTLPAVVALVVGPDRAWPLVAASNLLSSIILIPVTTAAMCLTYLDIRFRTEGLDIRRRMEMQFYDDVPGDGWMSPQMPS